MQSNSSNGEEAIFLQPKILLLIYTVLYFLFHIFLQTMKDQGLRRVLSNDNIKPEETPTNSAKPSEVEQVTCECCGMAEDCTPTYISRVREKFYGKWLCGLCTEAVQEKKRKYRKFNNEQALEAHMTICKQFNRNTRVNPNLSLADAMINFARKRSQMRDSSRTPAMVRTCSCGPWINH